MTTPESQPPSSDPPGVDPLIDELKQRVSDLNASQTPPEGDDETTRRRAAAELLYQQASETRAKALKEHERAAQLRSRLAQTEADQRQVQLDLDLERERLEGDRADLEAQREQFREEIDSFDQQVQAQAQQVAAQEDVKQVSFLQVLLRSFVLALVVGGAAAGSWFVLQQDTTHISEATVQTTDAGQSPGALAAAWIALPADAFTSQRQAEVWQQAVGEGRVQLDLKGDGQLAVRLQGPSPVENSDLLTAAFEAFKQDLSTRGVDRANDPDWQSWDAQRALLATQLDAWQKQLGELQVRRRDIPGEDDWRAARAELDRQRAAAAALTDELNQARAAMLGLQSLDLPRGAVSTEMFAAALRDDPVYVQDAEELESQAREFQAELLLGQVLLVEPLGDLRTAALSLTQAIGEQVDLKPSLPVQEILEEAASETEDLSRLLTQFTQTWTGRKQEVELLKPADQVDKLVAAQQAAFESLGRITEEVTRVQGVLRENVRQLGELPGGGTRENVVAAMLRGEISHLGEKLRVVTEGKERLDAESNFKLDAADRQVRSLRGRLRDRQKRVQEELQAAADEEARGNYQETLLARQREISELDARRDEAMDAVIQQFEVLGELEISARALIGLDAETAALQREVTAIETRRTALLEAEPQPTIPEVQLAQLQHIDRETDDLLETTGYVGGGMAGLTFLGSALLMASFAGRRRKTGSGPLDV